MPYGATNAKGKLKYKGSYGRRRTIDYKKGISIDGTTGDLDHGKARPRGKKKPSEGV
jgi:hypothetical protein